MQDNFILTQTSILPKLITFYIAERIDNELKQSIPKEMIYNRVRRILAVADLEDGRQIVRAITVFAQELGLGNRTRFIRWLNSAILSISRGLCQGLAICHGAMTAIGKKKWWESVLGLVQEWDGSEEQFHRRIFISSAETEATLGELLNRVVNYVFYYHAETSIFDDDVESIHAIELSTFLMQPIDIRFYGFSSDVAAPSTESAVLQRKCVALVGSFSSEELRKLLVCPPCYVCLICDVFHAVEFSVDHGSNLWSLYEPNEGVLPPVNFDQFVENISRKFKTAISILYLPVLGGTAEYNFDPIYGAYYEALRNSRVLGNTTLHLMCEYTPDVLISLLQKAGINHELQCVVADALTFKDARISSLFSTIVSNYPKLLVPFLNLAEGSRIIRNRIVLELVASSDLIYDVISTASEALIEVTAHSKLLTQALQNFFDNAEYFVALIKDGDPQVGKAIMRFALKHSDWLNTNYEANETKNCLRIFLQALRSPRDREAQLDILLNRNAELCELLLSGFLIGSVKLFAHEEGVTQAVKAWCATKCASEALHDRRLIGFVSEPANKRSAQLT
jgi:hypothetical protein